MNRLTLKIRDGFYTTHNINSTDDLKYKLGKLEDVEEEIGIDLITLFKALKEGIFVAYDSDFGMTNKPKIKITKDIATGICCRDKKWYIQEDETLLKDYGKTWALTREELENDRKAND